MDSQLLFRSVVGLVFKQDTESQKAVSYAKKYEIIDVVIHDLDHWQKYIILRCFSVEDGTKFTKVYNVRAKALYFVLNLVFSDGLPCITFGALKWHDEALEFGSEFYLGSCFVFLANLRALILFATQ